MLRHGWTQESLAKAIGCNRVHLNSILAGRKEGARIRIRLHQEFGFPAWILSRVPRSQAA